MQLFLLFPGHWRGQYNVHFQTTKKKEKKKKKDDSEYLTTKLQRFSWYFWGFHKCAIEESYFLWRLTCRKTETPQKPSSMYLKFRLNQKDATGLQKNVV